MTTTINVAATEGQELKPGQNRVTFPSERTVLAGDLFLPDSYRPGQRLPVIVVAGSWTTVKEQMAGLYARRLAERGFAALAFDFRNFGDSGGEPRQYESPELKIRDVEDVVAFARSLPVSDGEAVGALGICASAGYMAHAIARGAPIRSFAAVAPWLHDPATVSAFYGGEEGVRRRIETAGAAREEFERSGTVKTVPAYDPDDPDAAMFFPLDYYAEADRGAVPQWTNRFAVMSWLDWLTFDALTVAEEITIPTMLVHSDDAALPDNVRRFYAELRGPKDLVWTQGQQTDFYDQDPQAAKAVRLVAAHFDTALRRGRVSAGDTGRPVREHGDGSNGGTLVGDADVRATDVVAAMLHAVDDLDWDTVRSSFTAEVATDYTSLWGGEAERLPADDLVTWWRQLAPGYDATQHLIGPVVVTHADERGVTCTTNVRAYHHVVDEDGAATWMVAGRYVITLERAANDWKIRGITLHLAYEEGDRGLVDVAKQRVASGAGGRVDQP